MTVVELGGRRRRGGNNSDGGGGGDPRDRWLKRQANLVVSQLPEDPEEAVRVLELARKIVRYLSGH